MTTFTAAYTHRDGQNIRHKPGKVRPQREIVIVEAADRPAARRELARRVGFARVGDYLVQPARGTEPIPVVRTTPPPDLTVLRPSLSGLDFGGPIWRHPVAPAPAAPPAASPAPPGRAWPSAGRCAAPHAFVDEEERFAIYFQCSTFTADLTVVAGRAAALAACDDLYDDFVAQLAARGEPVPDDGVVRYRKVPR